MKTERKENDTFLPQKHKRLRRKLKECGYRNETIERIVDFYIR